MDFELITSTVAELSFRITLSCLVVFGAILCLDQIVFDNDMPWPLAVIGAAAFLLGALSGVVFLMTLIWS